MIKYVNPIEFAKTLDKIGLETHWLAMVHEYGLILDHRFPIDPNEFLAKTGPIYRILKNELRPMLKVFEETDHPNWTKKQMMDEVSVPCIEYRFGGTIYLNGDKGESKFGYWVPLI